MRNAEPKFFLALALASLLAVACAHGPFCAGESVSKLGPPLTKLAAAADADEGFRPAPELSDGEFLRRAEPEAFAFFKNHKLKLLRNSGHAVVLVCDSEGKTALLEDAGWTGHLEYRHYQERDPKPCEFTISIAK